MHGHLNAKYNIICLNEAEPVLHTEWHQSCSCIYDTTRTHTHAIWFISKSPQTYSEEVRGYTFTEKRKHEWNIEI